MSSGFSFIRVDGKCIEALQPQTSGLTRVMSELIRLYDLVRLSEESAKPTDWIFNAYLLRITEEANRKLRSGFIQVRSVCIISVPCDCQISARRMSDDEVPASIHIATNVATKMEGIVIRRRKDITAPSIMSSLSESVPDSAREFTSYENFQSLTFRASFQATKRLWKIV